MINVKSNTNPPLCQPWHPSYFLDLDQEEQEEGEDLYAAMEEEDVEDSNWEEDEKTPNQLGFDYKLPCEFYQEALVKFPLHQPDPEPDCNTPFKLINKQKSKNCNLHHTAKYLI